MYQIYVFSCFSFQKIINFKISRSKNKQPNLVSEVKHVEESQVEDAVEAEEPRHRGYLGAGVRRQREGREGGRGGRGRGAQRGGGGALAEEESGDGGCEGRQRQEVLGKHHKRVIRGDGGSVLSPLSSLPRPGQCNYVTKE